MGSYKGKLSRLISKKIFHLKVEKALRKKEKAGENSDKKKVSTVASKNTASIQKSPSPSQSESPQSRAASVSTYENADMLMRRSNAKKKEADFQKKVGTAMSARGYANERKLMDLSGKSVSMSGNDRLKRADKIYKSAKKDSLSSVNMINDLKNPKSKTNRSATKGVSWINKNVMKNLKKK
jgi:hypothetical protein